MSNPILHYYVQGQGAPLIIIHGLFGSLRNWQSLSKRYAEHFTVVTVDLRNHGESFHDPEMNYQLMAEDMLCLMNKMNLTSVNLLGHSMGGKVAMKLTHLQPEIVNKLVVADIAPVRYLHNYDDLIDAILSVDLTVFNKRKLIEDQLAISIADSGIRQFLMQNLVIKDTNVHWKINWTAIKNNMKSIIGFDSISDWHIFQQSLFIRGALSGYVSEEAQKRINRHFDNASFATIADAGHWLHAENPEEFLQTTLQFLQSN